MHCHLTPVYCELFCSDIFIYCTDRLVMMNFFITSMADYFSSIPETDIEIDTLFHLC